MIESGVRASLSSAELDENPSLVVGLVMPDEARGEGSLLVKVAATNNRLFEATGVPLPGSGTGLRLEIDRAWLQPGGYLIQVQTAEKTPLAVRRYFLEIRE
jgi:hypothetical protein